MNSFETLRKYAGFCALCLGMPLGGCTYHQYCAKYEECSEEKLGEEFQEICVIENEGLLAEYRANEEESCLELAEAKEDMDLCRLTQEECRDFNNQTGGEACQEQVERYETLLMDTLITCSQLD